MYRYYADIRTYGPRLGKRLVPSRGYVCTRILVHAGRWPQHRLEENRGKGRIRQTTVPIYQPHIYTRTRDSPYILTALSLPANLSSYKIASGRCTNLRLARNYRNADIRLQRVSLPMVLSNYSRPIDQSIKVSVRIDKMFVEIVACSESPFD